MALLATSQTFVHRDFSLENGGRFGELTVAYETYGTLDPGGGNGILLCHGFTNNQHAAGDDAGWWNNLIGPGKALDTDRWFVVCSNMIGSAYGSTSPASIDPASGAPYGPDFPHVTTADMVAAQALLLDHLGVGQLAAVVGYSYGGNLAYLWGVTHPDRMRAIVPVATGIKARGGAEAVTALHDRLATAPGWNGGRYYGNEQDGGIYEALVDLRIETLRQYGVERILTDQLGDIDSVESTLVERSRKWAEEFDANSLIALRRAGVGFDVSARLSAIQAPLLYVLCRTDPLFPPDIAPPVMELLDQAGVDAAYFEIDSEYRHAAPGADWRKWAGVLGDFLARHS